MILNRRIRLSERFFVQSLTPHTHGVLASDEKLAALEDLMLRNECDDGPIDVEGRENQDQDMEDPKE